MHLWEFALACDAEADLTTPSGMAAFLSRVEYSFGRALRDAFSVSELPADWDPRFAEEWRTAVNVLRSLAPRLKGRRGRKAEIDPLEADRIFEDHIGRLRPVLRRVNIGAGPVWKVPLGVKTFAGVVLRPAYSPTEREETWARYGNEWAIFAFTATRYWRDVFGSMVTDDFAPVCGRCGTELGLTPKGKRPRAGLCAQCRYKAWYEEQPRKRLREKWRSNKAAQRAEAKRVISKGKRP